MMQDAYQKYFDQLNRSFFIDGDSKSWASLDQALPIGFGQTISQPTLVLAMTRWLDLRPNSRVLEIGTGSGYQTAFLARFAGRVYSVEKIPELQDKAKVRLAQLGFENIHYHLGDGSLGWPKNAPYDRIMVTAASRTIPDELLDQLRPGGKMVIPVGVPYLQDLLLVSKDQHGTVSQKVLEKVVFVELKGPYGWSGG